MIPEITPVNKFILAENKQYSYTVQPFELTNILGAVVAVLDEYFITDSSSENYKLYKTKEGNWYDVNNVTLGNENRILGMLKIAIERLENHIGKT
jgi:hypothetical protein